MTALLVAWGCFGATAESKADWWDARWECRVAIDLRVPATVEALPVVIRGDELLTVCRPRVPTVSSLRLVDAAQEVPIQVDERDGTGTYQPHPNHVLDDDDELVFQIDLQAGTSKRLWVYFSERGRPLGNYRTPLFWHRQSLRVGGELTHLVLRNRNLKVAFKGPKTADPMANVLGNFANGACSQVRYRDFEYINPRSAYTFFIPHHLFAAGPHPSQWSLPHVISDGPVRKIARMDLQGYKRTSTDGKVDLQCDVVHCYGVWARGGVIDFEELVVVGQGPKQWSLRYSFPLAVQLSEGSAVRFGRDDAIVREVVDAKLAERIATSQSHVGVWRSSENAGSWWAAENPRQGYGMAVLAGKLRTEPATEAEYQSIVNGYHATTQGYLSLNLADWPGSGTVHQKMRFVAYDTDECDSIAARRLVWLKATDAWIRCGQVETRGTP